MLIRPATPADVEALVSLLQLLFLLETDFTAAPDRQRRGLRLLLDDPRALLLVAQAEGRVVGMCSGQLLLSTAEGGYSALVEDVIVLPAWRGQGLGRALLAAVGDWARSRAATRLQLLADRGNYPALAFYERMGWEGTELICRRKGIIPPDASLLPTGEK